MRICIPVLICLLAAASCSSPAETDAPPNIILILTDDQGWGDLSLTGNPNFSTPNIDALASQGTFMEHFYVSPVCSPTRAEILTGRYHPRSGVYSTSQGGERINPEERTIAEILKERGYQTAAFGKWHSGTQYPYHPNGQGFDEFYGFCSGHWGTYFSPMLERNGQIVKGNGFLSDDLTDHAISFIRKHSDDPFFVYLPYNIPHSPMQVPDSLWNHFADLELADHRYSDKERKEHSRAAYALCKNIDENVGRLTRELEQLDLDEETIIIFLSDNGPNGWRWNGGLKGKKGSTDEGGVRSPLIIRWPGKINGGKRIANFGAGIDLLPTLLDLAGLPEPDSLELDGVTLAPLLTEDNPQWPERMIANHWRGRTSIRSNEFRLDHQGQLFHLPDDPGQEKDVSESYPEQLAAMKAFQEKWTREVLSELPEEDTRPFTVGHPDYPYYQLPARDGEPHGAIERSNRWPNCSFFTNWKSIEDSISWPIEVLQTGTYRAQVYYTCPEQSLGAKISLHWKSGSVSTTLTEAHDPPLKGMEKDRVERKESYVKDFQPLDLGEIHLTKGKDDLRLKVSAVPEDLSESVLDVRLIHLTRVAD